ncbi:adenylate kinase [Patescibacteria group bacterium]
MIKDFKRIVIIGPQGSGKGTQAELLADQLKVPNVSTGEIFRANIEQKTDLGKKAEILITNGQLVSDEITNAMLAERLAKPDASHGYILDGYPRNKNQAEFLDKLSSPDKVIELTLTDQSAIERISSRLICSQCGATFSMKIKPPKFDEQCDNCGHNLIHRDDDKPEAVKQRLQIYHRTTMPLIKYYQDQGKLISVDGTPAIAEVAKLIADLLSRNE